MEIVGLIPAAGKARRISPIPCSKELFPVGLETDDRKDIRIKVVSHYLLEKMKLAGASKGYIILRDGKWDIPAYWGDGAKIEMPIAYLMMGSPHGVPYTLDQAYPFVKDKLVFFGFPDIIFEPDDAFAKLGIKLQESGTDLVLGLFPAHQPEKMDMVEIDAATGIRNIQIKPQQTDLRYTWIIAVWGPRFTQFMHDCIRIQQPFFKNEKTPGFYSGNQEIYLGHIIQAAIDQKISTDAIIFEEGTYLDVGTPDDLAKAVKLYFHSKV